MAKELPYFRFTVQEWQNGKVSLESYELRGLFIDVCGYYWAQDCSIARATLEKRYKDAIPLLNELIELEIIKVEENTNNIVISFLDEQYDLLSNMRLKRVEAGKQGGLNKSSNAKAKLKQSPSYKDKDNDNVYKQFSENVSMTDEEHKKLVEVHGIDKTKKFIEVLGNYKGSSGKKYKSDYRAILSWVVEKVLKDWKESKPLYVITDQQHKELFERSKYGS
jgi:hypothetical protein